MDLRDQTRVIASRWGLGQRQCIRSDPVEQNCSVSVHPAYGRGEGQRWCQSSALRADTACRLAPKTAAATWLAARTAGGTSWPKYTLRIGHSRRASAIGMAGQPADTRPNDNRGHERARISTHRDYAHSRMRADDKAEKRRRLPMATAGTGTPGAGLCAQLGLRCARKCAGTYRENAGGRFVADADVRVSRRTVDIYAVPSI